MSRPVALGEGGVAPLTATILASIDTESGYSAPEFQRKLKDLMEKSPNNVQVVGRMELALTVQRNVLPKYGFSGDIAGVEAMRDTICPFMVDWMVKKIVDDIDKVLGLPPNSTEKAAQGPGISRQTTPATSAEPSSAASSTSSEDGDVSEFMVATDKTLQDVTLTKAQIIELLGEILEGFSTPDFQNEFQQLSKKDPRRKALVSKVQSQMLPKYGLPGDSYGYMLVLDALTPYVDDFLVNYLLSEMDNKIGLPKDTTANMCKGQVSEPEIDRTETSTKAKSLNRRQVLMLCNELLDGFTEADFQARLQALLKRSAGKKFVPERATLALSVQREVLPNYGFPGTTPGVLQMLDAIAPFAGDWSVVNLINSIDEALGLPAGTTLSSLPEPTA